MGINSDHDSFVHESEPNQRAVGYFQSWLGKSNALRDYEIPQDDWNQNGKYHQL